MGNCWPKIKFKATQRNNETNKNYSNCTTKNENAATNITNKNNDFQNNNTIPLNDTLKTESIILQPRRDLEGSIDIPINTPPQPLTPTVVNNTTTTTTTTTTTNFKQFCKNSAGKLTHKLSFNKSKQYCDNDNSIINESKINILFDKYKDNKEINFILANGIQQLCDDLSLKADDFKILLFAWKLNAKQMCKFTKDEFLNGFKTNLKVDNLKDLKQKLDYLEDDIKLNQDEFRNLYRWTFDFGLDSDTGERAIPIEMALLLWELVYMNQEPAILSKWIAFLKDHLSIKGIPRDTWNMFPLFASSIGEFHYHLYDDNEAWPCLFDDFVQAAVASANEIKLDINNNNNNNICESL
jgi:DCN1-like protein 3